MSQKDLRELLWDQFLFCHQQVTSLFSWFPSVTQVIYKCWWAEFALPSLFGQQPWPWSPDGAGQSIYSGACWPQGETQMCRNPTSCCPPRLFPAYQGCCADEPSRVEVSHDLETVSGSGRKFSEAKQERNGPKKHPPPHLGA